LFDIISLSQIAAQMGSRSGRMPRDQLALMVQWLSGAAFQMFGRMAQDTCSSKMLPVQVVMALGMHSRLEVLKN
jgi:hypothetical protein